MSQPASKSGDRATCRRFSDEPKTEPLVLDDGRRWVPCPRVGPDGLPQSTAVRLAGQTGELSTSSKRSPSLPLSKVSRQPMWQRESCSHLDR